jgi:hypothetical protein
MRRSKLSLLLALAFLVPSSASAAGFFTFALGGWKGFFSQALDGGASTKQSTDPSLAFQMSAGLRFDSGFFVEWAPYLGINYLGTKFDDEEEANDATSWTLLAANFGFRIPAVGVEVYAGSGIGNFDFTFGSEAGFAGTMGRLGVSVPIGSTDRAQLRVKLDYTRLFIDTDEQGSIPERFSTRADTLFIGLMVSFGPNDPK